jgi:hypothetical protein
MVRPFEGPKAKTIHDKVVSTLEAEGVILIPPGFEEGVKLEDEPEPYIEVARKNQIKAYVHGTTKMTKREWALTLNVRNASDGQTIGELRIASGSLQGLLKKIDKELMGGLDEHLLKTAAPGRPTPPEEEGADPDGASLSAGVSDLISDKPPERPDEGTPKAPSPLDARLGFGVVQRALQYYQAVADPYEHQLQPHPVVAPALALGVHWYPAAHGLGGPLANVGLALSYYRSVAGSTTVNSSTGKESFTTTFSELNLGLRGRIPMKSYELGLNGGWGVQSLVMDGDNEGGTADTPPDPGVVPDMEYTFFRFGPDVRFDPGVPIDIGLAYRMITIQKEDGYLAEQRWFPSAAGIGLDGYAKFMIGLTDTLGLELGGELRYYGVKANAGSPEQNLDDDNPFDPDAPGIATSAVAGGLYDMYIGGFVSVQYTMPGEAE